ncbi:hypothetical protein IMAU10142_01311 [Lactobacillus helveticus]|uniref:Alkaline phosphatase n=2 Tax=Lactobacillus helveticus TaxID=1587 RepID=U4QGL7_LACHE|nr:hypothetical protein [Lactobacillus helveticus]CDI42256.1 Alkaline phosphatase [Lactobacillus helveticus CIRM-BIA 953]NRN75139.1 hypothetical protein [Lactobacillus helveticus]NRN76936.1 hypothetical protein [Lactobacillus helveticus]NRN81413.1 hypothetical protein [Lactobacillus helveticus]
MTNFVFDLINQFSYMAISFLIAIENVFPPIPSEVIYLLQDLPHTTPK